MSDHNERACQRCGSLLHHEEQCTVKTHAELVAEAARWLCNRCAVVLTELVTSGEVPDAIGWRSGLSILVECKTSRADFMADSKKPFRQHPAMGIGHYRYFLAPDGLIAVEELPPRWGLLELVEGRGVRVSRKPELFDEVNTSHEIDILLSTLRRIGHSAPAGVSIKCYTIQTGNTATLHVEPEEVSQ